MILDSDRLNPKPSLENPTEISSHPDSNYDCQRRLPRKGKYKHETFEIKPFYERLDDLLTERPLKRALLARQNSEQVRGLTNEI